MLPYLGIRPNGFQLAGVGVRIVNSARLNGFGDGGIVNGVRVSGFGVNGVRALNMLAVTALRLNGVWLNSVYPTDFRKLIQID